MIRAMQLADWVSTRNRRTFCWQSWNCATMALDWMLYLSGRYDERLPSHGKQVARRIIADHPEGFAGVCDQYLDLYGIATARPPAALAMTGDVIGLGAQRVALIGILASNGQVITPSASGLTLATYPLRKYRTAWRVL
jgi:hypothetical protein